MSRIGKIMSKMSVRDASILLDGMKNKKKEIKCVIRRWGFTPIEMDHYRSLSCPKTFTKTMFDDIKNNYYKL